MTLQSLTTLVRSYVNLFYNMLFKRNVVINDVNNVDTICNYIKKQNKNEKVKNFLYKNDETSFLDAIESVSDIHDPHDDFIEVKL